MGYAGRHDPDIPFEDDMQPETCIRCDNAPAVDENGYCGHCHWSVKAEVDEGFYHLCEYLRLWARFDEWCAGRRAA